MKRILIFSGLLIVISALIFGATYAAFSDKGKYTGSSFNVGSADIKLLNDLSQGIDPANLVDEKPGPVFNNISPSWTGDYGVKLYNNATTPLNIFSTANYETANDPNELRQVIYCEIFDWDDANANGVVESEEIGTSHGMKQLIKWKTEGLDLGQIALGEAKGYLLRFTTTSSFSPIYQGKTGIFDFEFNATGI
jgi:predicted ribosomally synthesized peptide with SipW-like signal peptide